MDIWYAERELDSEGIDFSFPANAGMDINTMGDEVTPFYSVDDGMLFFSSNGKVNIGGFDIYKANGSKAFWENVQLLAYPVNSSADDYFYRTKPNSYDGFFVSNRTYGMEKITTTQEDIFAFSHPVAKAFVSGVVQDKLSKKPIQEVQVSLYELLDNEHLRLLEAKVVNNGNYKFGLIPNRRFRVEARKAGYETNRYDFETDALVSLKEFGQEIVLQKMATYRRPRANNKKASNKKTNTSSPIAPVRLPDGSAKSTRKSNKATKNSKPNTNSISTTKAIINNSEKAYTTKAKTPGEPYPYISKAKKLEGVYYKVQIISVVKFDVNHKRYEKVKSFGQFNTEYIPKVKLTRVLLGDYFDLEEAKRIQVEARKSRSFRDAYIVRYENGKRMGRWL